MKIRPATFKHIEAELYAYHDTRKEIEKLREAILYGFEDADENVGGGRSTAISRPTERSATKLASNRRLRNLEEIAEAIRKVYIQSSDDCKKLIEVRYWGQTRFSWDEIAREVNMSKRQAIRKRDGIVNAIADVLGWR